jgi:cephalosporin hydroxylase
MSQPDVAYWKTIPGWFNFEDVYKLAVANSQDGDTLVEVGVFLGKSLCMLLDEVSQSGKKLSVVGVDKFEIDDYFGQVKLPWGELASEWKAREGENVLYEKALDYISQSPHKAHLTEVRRAGSNTPTALPSPRTCSFVYLDANHTYEFVLADLNAWYPAVRPGGLLAGHDLYSKGYNCGVRQAVEDFVAAHPGMTFEPMGPNSWIIRV